MYYLASWRTATLPRQFTIVGFDLPFIMMYKKINSVLFIVPSIRNATKENYDSKSIAVG